MIFKPLGKGGPLDQGYLMVLFIQGRKKRRSDCPGQVNFLASENRSLVAQWASEYSLKVCLKVSV